MKTICKLTLSYLFFATLFLIFPCNATSEEIIFKQVDSLDSVIAELKKANEETLVVFDVDYVLLVPKDLIARPASHELRHILFPKIEKEVGTNKLQYYLSILRLQGGSALSIDDLTESNFTLAAKIDAIK